MTDKVFKIALVSFRWCRFGGWVSFKRHLMRALESVQLKDGTRVQVEALSVESPTGHHDWVDKWTPAQGELDVDAVILCVLPTVSKDTGFYRDLTRQMGLQQFAKEEKLFAVIHDPTEYTTPVRGFLKWLEPAVFFIRDAVANHTYSEDAAKTYTVIPHPYERQCVGDPPPMERLGCEWVCTSRIDFDKGTHIILAANKVLKPDDRVHFHTGGVNRLYNYHTLIPEFGSIMENPLFHGPFEDVGPDVLEVAHGLVDMSSISGDGGGTQYTFLEAMDYGLWLILNRAWSTPSGELRHGYNCHMVKGAQGLATAINDASAGQALYNRHSYVSLLAAHDHRRVGKIVLSYILNPDHMLRRRPSGFLR